MLLISCHFDELWVHSVPSPGFLKAGSRIGIRSCFFYMYVLLILISWSLVQFCTINLEDVLYDLYDE